jgi:hypothetical protein
MIVFLLAAQRRSVSRYHDAKSRIVRSAQEVKV